VALFQLHRYGLGAEVWKNTERDRGQLNKIIERWVYIYI